MSENGATTKPAVVERRPVGLFEQMEREMDELRRQMFGIFRRPGRSVSPPAFLNEVAWAPTADAYEQDGTLVVKAELPGVKKEDVSVTLDQGILTIAGHRQEEQEQKEARYYTCERFSGSFQRAFGVPEGIDPKAVKADFKDGVLEVHVPLPASAKSTPASITIGG